LLWYSHFCSDDKDEGGSSGGGLTGTSGTFVDSRDSTSYKWVKIGKQFWMAENLNYAAAVSRCYGEDGQVDKGGYILDGSKLITLSPAEIQVNCDTYGRLYGWQTADTICPKGWRLPNDADWNVLMKFISPSCSDADDSDCTGVGTKLKAISGWNNNGNGTDDYGFAALPGGYRDVPGSKIYYRVGERGEWWSSKRTDYTAYYWGISSECGHGYTDNAYLRSVRCVKD